MGAVQTEEVVRFIARRIGNGETSESELAEEQPDPNPTDARLHSEGLAGTGFDRRSRDSIEIEVERRDADESDCGESAYSPEQEPHRTLHGGS